MLTTLNHRQMARLSWRRWLITCQTSWATHRQLVHPSANQLTQSNDVDRSQCNTTKPNYHNDSTTNQFNKLKWKAFAKHTEDGSGWGVGSSGGATDDADAACDGDCVEAAGAPPVRIRSYRSYRNAMLFNWSLTCSSSAVHTKTVARLVLIRPSSRKNDP